MSAMLSMHAAVGLRASLAPPRRAVVDVRAFSSKRAGGTGGKPAATTTTTQERVLRYPGGLERRIRYPAAPPATDRCEPPASAAVTQLTCDPEDDGCMVDDLYWGDSREWDDGAATAADATKVAEAEPATEKRFFDDMWDLPASEAFDEAVEKVNQIPSSPADLIRHVMSDEYKQAQADLWARVDGCYEVLQSCPWITPRKVFCLAAGGGEGESRPGSFTLRTRVEVEGFQDELSKVFKNSIPDIGKKFTAAQMLDGLVTFEDEADAERFAAYLEAENSSQVQVAEVDSHECFRTVQDVKGVVVLLRSGCDLPSPAQLKASLQGKNPLEGL